ncbi:hypothetical protein ES703_50712 [subsurface metagenome]
MFASEFLAKGRGHLLISYLKIQQAFSHCLKAWKIIGTQNFFLHNTKVDFNLIKSAGMDR